MAEPVVYRYPLYPPHWRPCGRCAGTGRLAVSPATLAPAYQTCPWCGGTGKVVPHA